MNCPNCNKEVSPEWSVCSHCGYKPKKCSNPDCKSEWLPTEAIFCPECGKTLGRPSSVIDEKTGETTSIMELYPNLNLVPTSLIRRSGLFGWWLLYIFVILASIALLVIGIVILAAEGDEIGIPFIVGGVVMSVLWGIWFYKKILHHPYGGYKKLIKEANYVSGNRGLCVFVKNNCFGLIHLWSYRIFVPAIYDHMEWKPRDKYLRVKKGGRQFLIDIYNNEV